jgi:DNA mismatch endonuclease (patch repair protein)
MASIRSKDTRPELLVRSVIHRLGYRFRLHRKDLPGKPDIVFPGRRKIIFVHGCFWHLHNCANGQARQRTNPSYWKRKREGNAARDSRLEAVLKLLGWQVLVVWECTLTDLDLVRKSVRQFLES